jgi:hypothetical protein
MSKTNFILHKIMRFGELYFHTHHFPLATQRQKKKCCVAVNEQVMRAMPSHVGAKYYKNIF